MSSFPAKIDRTAYYRTDFPRTDFPRTDFPRTDFPVTGPSRAGGSVRGRQCLRRARAWPLVVAPALMLLGLALEGCSTGDAVVFKALAGEIPGEKGTIPPNLANGPVGINPPPVGRTRFRKDRQLSGLPGKRAKPKAAEKKPPTTSAIAADFARRNDALRAQVFRQDDELQRIRRSITLRHGAYMKAVGGFGLASHRRLPEDNANYRQNLRTARSQLGRINGDVLKLNALAARVNATASQTAALLAAWRTARARSRDRVARRELAGLEPALRATDALPRKMLAAIQVDITRQSAYTQEQSRGLDLLAEAVSRDTGKLSTRVRPLEAATLQEALRPQAGGRDGKGRARSARPLVRIRFTKPKVAYKDALYRALQAALKQRPDLAFEVVGVAPSEARQPGALSRAQEVRFAMADMGVPPERVTVTTETSPEAKSDEVRIFVR
jgi:hypothetical protein